jgi:hypothetical protein
VAAAQAFKADHKQATMLEQTAVAAAAAPITQMYTGPVMAAPVLLWLDINLNIGNGIKNGNVKKSHNQRHWQCTITVWNNSSTWRSRRKCSYIFICR